MSRTPSETDPLFVQIEELNREVEKMFTLKQQKGSPVSIATTFSPAASPVSREEVQAPLDEEFLLPPKPSESPDLSRAQRKTREFRTENPCAQVQNVKGLFPSPSSPKKTSKRSDDLAPYSTLSPGRK